MTGIVLDPRVYTKESLVLKVILREVKLNFSTDAAKLALHVMTRKVTIVSVSLAYKRLKWTYTNMK